jgi:hypothetical protein
MLAFTGLVLGVLIGLTTQAVKTEVYVQLWQRRVAGLEQVQDQLHNTAVAQEYGTRAVEAIRMMAIENGLLCERDAKMQKYVLTMEEENTKLKAALNESVDKMVELIEENSDLHEEINYLSYKVECLEKALDATSPPAPEPTDPRDNNPFITFLDTISVINAVTRILPILL